MVLFFNPQNTKNFGREDWRLIVLITEGYSKRLISAESLKHKPMIKKMEDKKEMSRYTWIEKCLILHAK